MKITIQAMNAHHGSTQDLERVGWIFEPKLDGVRALCHINKKAHFISRYNKDITQKYGTPVIRKFVKAKTAILDGEIIAYNSKGMPSFGALQQGNQSYYIIFDILMKNGRMLTSLPLHERKKILEDTIIDDEYIKKIPYTYDGKKLWHEIEKHDLEGVMAKDFYSAYYLGERSRVWLKIKRHETIDCVIMGYTTGRRVVSSLALGLYNSKKQLVYIGKVGTGFNQEMVHELHKKLTALSRVHYNFNIPDIDRSIIWVKPTYTCEVKFLEMTRDGRLRAPVFLRLRDDKKPEQCTFADNDLPEFTVLH